jgi:hypothetical protein
MTDGDNSLDVTLVDDALGDDCTCPEGCPHGSGDGDSGDIPCDPDCPIHGEGSVS